MIIISILLSTMVMMIYSQGVIIPEVEVLPNQCTDGRFVVKSPEDADQLHEALIRWYVNAD